ncbi:VOC family protein [Paracnuella aquatica]|uniref:VOC family protein n=1 Tax=Paracnuella aquatica TaxID=2268757 RepID=UPI000DEFAD3F|nr:VOC family protein [Paracnuella aquatica]RPD51368.1 VOC family protein [Paracnuella aquatica]
MSIKKWWIASSLLLAFAACTVSKPAATSLDHIALYTQNLKTSTHFYQHVLGLDTIPEPFHDGKHTWFTVGGGAALHLIVGLGAPVAQNKNTHLCFRKASLQPLIERLVAAGVPYEDWAGTPSSITTRVDGVHQIYFKDPDGHWIEVNDARNR